MMRTSATLLVRDRPRVGRRVPTTLRLVNGSALDRTAGTALDRSSRPPHAGIVTLQGRLGGAGVPAIDPEARFERRCLDDVSWVDVARDFLRGADTLFEHLRVEVPWTQGRRWMYEREVDDPRLSRWYEPGEALPHDALVAVGDALGIRYGVPFEGL